MAKKKVYLISQTYPTSDYGDTTFINNEAIYLKDKCDITVLCLNRERSQTIPHDGIKCVYLDFSLLKAIRYIPFFFFDPKCYSELIDIKANNREDGMIIPQIKASLRMYISAKWFESKVKRIVRRDEEAVFYSFWADFPIIGLLNIKNRFPKCSFISRIHGYELYDEQDKSGRVPFRPYLNSEIDKLIFIGKNPQEYYMKRHPELDSGKAFLCRLGINPIDSTRAKRDAEDRMLLISCSNLIPLKRVELIVKALSAYAKDTKIKWIHFGDGPCLKEIEEKASILSDSSMSVDYELRGYVENDDVRKFYEDTIVDCFITTSSSEGCPVSVMEALSVGTPVIGTAVGDIPHMINGNGVLLSADPTVDEVKSAIENIAGAFSNRDNASNYYDMRKRSKELFDEMFDSKTNTERFINNVLMS